MFIADLHIHSRYSRATSQANEPIELDYWCRRKGMHLLGTGDFTHAAYRAELAEKLIPTGDGLYRLKDELRRADAGIAGDNTAPRFIISSEISSIYKDKGKTRKVHNCILLPSLEAAAQLSAKLEALGCNLRADGRPIIGLSSRNLLELTLDTCAEALFIPAHIWTPHFSMLGMYSGYDCIEDCFDDLTPHIYALETGLSSDPQMNARLSQHDKYAFVSNSDAHSPANLAREANLFDCELSYSGLYNALAISGSKDFSGTIEFFPEEGKYHWDGHRACKYSCRPSEAIADNNICPVCGGKLILGVSHRLEELADRPEDYLSPQMRPYESLVPLLETVAACARMTKASKKVQQQYENLLQNLGSEFYILREAPLSDIAAASNAIIAEGVSRIRAGRLSLAPGYDGEYGKVTIFSAEELDELTGQTSLFANLGYTKQPARQKKKQAAQAEPLPTVGKSDESAPSSLPYGLNPAQWQAVSSPAAEVVVMAGPGTGKTRTLIYRIIHLLEQGIAPEQIMAVTFTNKAASELKERLLSYCKSKKLLNKMHIGTFHSLALQQLREQKTEISLLGDNNARIFATEVIAELGLKISAAQFLRQLSAAKNNNPHQLDKQAIAAYQAKLAEYDAYDFDDLLLSALELAEKQPEIFCARHLLVDEFQDINDLQLRLINAWRQQSKSTFVIGDPNQSIYGFRGADSTCFICFLQTCRAAEQIYLQENYRSTREIINCANSLLQDKQHPIYTSRTNKQPVRLISAENALTEGIFIATEIDRRLGGLDMISAHNSKSKKGRTISLSDIAVLYRTHRQAEQISYCLTQAGIPFTISGRDSFLHDEQVQLCLTFLRMSTDNTDRLSARLCHSLLPKRKLEQLTEIFAPLWKSPPSHLIDTWIDANFLAEHTALEQLRNTALLTTDLPSLLNNTLYGEEADIIRSGNHDYCNEAVSLMTLHGAKGLEFPLVFVAGLKEGLLPFQAQGMTGDLEEERRLFYVGITRAKEELLIISQNEPSTLLAELDQSLLQEEVANPKARTHAKQLALFDK